MVHIAASTGSTFPIVYLVPSSLFQLYARGNFVIFFKQIPSYEIVIAISIEWIVDAYIVFH